MNGLLRTRIVLAGVAMLVVSVAAGDIFDRWVWELPPAVALPAAVTVLVQPLRGRVRVVAYMLVVPLTVGSATLVAGGGWGDVRAAFVSGIQGLLTTDWPSPLRSDLVGATAMMLALATAVSGEAAGRERWHLLPLAPIVVAYTTVVGLSAPLGVRLHWLVALGLIAAAFATLRPDGTLSDRWTLVRGERRLVPIVLGATVVAGLVSVPVAMADRADPRRNDPAITSAPLLDPIEAALALQSIDPPIDIHRITARSGAQLPGRWRSAALTTYDGRRWAPALTLRPIGRRLGPDAAGAISYDVFFLDDDIDLVPLPGAPVTIDGAVETDAGRTVVRLIERRAADEPLSATSLIAPTAIAATDGIATKPVDPSVSGLAAYAAELAGDGTVVERLRRIEATMSDDFVLAPDAPGGGLQRALIERFLRDTRRGNAEQFATGFVLLAQSLGVDARVATGFVVDSSGESIVLASSDAAVWPEVRLIDGGWLAFDPVPTVVGSDSAATPDEPTVQTPAAAQPPVVPPPEPTGDTQTDDTTVDRRSDTALSFLWRWTGRVGIGLSALVVPALIAMASILVVKSERRRRRLSRSDPAGRVRGAWAVATDRLIDAGLTIGPSASNGDIAEHGVPLAGLAYWELHHLASLSDAVTFGRPPHPDRLAADAVECLELVESSMNTDRPRPERVRRRLSMRSLRRATRSPVDLPA